MVTVRETEFLGKKSYEISNGNVELVVVTGIGPRIASFKTKNGENVLKCYDNDYLNRSAAHKFYGGHRFWHSPEDAVRTYQPDNDDCLVEMLDLGIKVTSFERENKLEKVMEIEMNEEGRVRIIHTLTNKNNFPLTLAPWSITMLKSGGVGVLATDSFDNGFLPNRSLALWSYSSLSDKRLQFLDRHIVLKQKDILDTPFKIGTMSHEGYMGYFVENQLFTVEYDVMDGDYPDFGCNIESYMRGDMLELEVLGQMTEMDTGESAEISEVWSLYESVTEPEFSDEDLDAQFKKRVKFDND